MQYRVYGVEGNLSPRGFSDATFLVGDGSETRFERMEVFDPHVWIEGETEREYIPRGKHHLPAHAAIPILHGAKAWEPPSDETLEEVRGILEATTNVAELGKPDWSRVRLLLSKLQDSHQPFSTPFENTDMGWQHRYFHKTFGGEGRDGWYHGANFRSGANGYDNHHYNRLFWMGVRLAYEPDKGLRDTVLWPYFLQQSMAHLCFGRFWGGKHEGLARDEKGTHYVGDSGRVPYEKQWCLNLVMPYLLTGRHPIFGDMLYRCVKAWNTRPVVNVWNGSWGVRIAARALEEYVTLGITVPTARNFMAQLAQGMLDQLKRHLDRASMIWPNVGNRGAAPESPWMQAQAVTAIFRCWELMPETRAHGPYEDDLHQIASNILSHPGSEIVNGYWLLRYRYKHVTTGEPTSARFLANTAFAYPMLRYLYESDRQRWMWDLESIRDLLQNYAGSTVADVADGKPHPIEKIGFRFPREGGGWSKAMLHFIDALR